MIDDILAGFTIEDLPNEDMQLVADSIGLEAAMKLMRDFQGVQLNIPKNWHINAVKRYIVANNHMAVKKLAVRCNVSSRFVYSVLAAYRAGNMSELMGISEE
jgi:hypothetical protein